MIEVTKHRMIRYVSYVLPLIVCLSLLCWKYIVNETLFCSAAPPSWVKDLSKELSQYEVPGFQFSYTSATNSLHCAKGWAEVTSWKNVTGEPLTIEHRFRYLSLSKILTAILTLEMFNREGELDSIVIDILDLSESEFSDSRWQNIKISHLLTHRAGLGLWRGIDPMLVPHPPCPYSSSWLNKVILESDPGRHFSYSNIGYCLLGQLGEKLANGQAYSDLLQKRFFDEFPDISLAVPVHNGGMKDVTLYPDVSDRKEMISSLDYRALSAVGGWSGSAKSFSKILHRELSEGSIIMKRNHELNISDLPGCEIQLWRRCHLYGVYMYKLDAESPVFYWRDGSLPGATAFAGWFGNGEVIVLLMNTRELPWIDFNDQIGQRIYKAMMGKG